MYKVDFLEPARLEFLWIVAVIFLAGFLLWLLELYRRPDRTAGSKFPFVGTMKFWFALIFVLALSVLAWARPFLPKNKVSVKRGAAEIIFVVDFSASMFLKDTGWARIDIAGKEITQAVLNGAIRKGDRAALLVFGKIFSPRIPLTKDLDAFVNEAAKIGRPTNILTGDLYWGSVVSVALKRTYELLDRQDMFIELGKESPDWKPKFRNDRLVIFFSDGDFFSYGKDEVDADSRMEMELESLKSVLREFKKRGLVVYTVGIGTRQGAPLTDILKDYENELTSATLDSLREELKGQSSRLNLSNLEKLAQTTGGSAFSLEHTGVSAGGFVKSAIDKHRSAFIEAAVEEEKQELWLYFVLAALALFAVGLAVTKF